MTDEQIMDLASKWFITGENQHRHDGYYYRSQGTPTNVRGSDLVAFARAVLAASQEAFPDNVAPERRAEVERMSRQASQRFLRDAKDGPRYRYMRDVYAEKFDAIIDAAMAAAASRGTGE